MTVYQSKKSCNFKNKNQKHYQNTNLNRTLTYFHFIFILLLVEAFTKKTLYEKYFQGIRKNIYTQIFLLIQRIFTVHKIVNEKMSRNIEES